MISEECREEPTGEVVEVQEAHVDELFAIPGVVGVGIGECDGVPCIKVLVAEATPEVLAQIPECLEGHPVAVEESREFRALDRR